LIKTAIFYVARILVVPLEVPFADKQSELLEREGETKKMENFDFSRYTFSV